MFTNWFKVNDIPQCILPHAPLGGEACYGPHTDLDPKIELLPSHIPHALVRQGLSLRLKFRILFIIIQDGCQKPTHCTCLNKRQKCLFEFTVM